MYGGENDRERTAVRKGKTRSKVAHVPTARLFKDVQRLNYGARRFHSPLKYEVGERSAQRQATLRSPEEVCEVGHQPCAMAVYDGSRSSLSFFEPGDTRWGLPALSTTAI
eukprot:3719400-Rhodomonas_salina.1